MSKIYIITNDINDKVYVGKTEFSIEKRFREHCADSLKERCEKRPLYAAMRKYGVEHFSIKEIEECNTEEAPFREQFWIGFYKGYEEGYNATRGGDGKPYIDRQEILNLWNSGKSVKEIVEITKHDPTYTSNILYSFGVDRVEVTKRGIQNYSKYVLMLDKKTEEVLEIFPSTREAARFLIEKYGLKPESESGYSSHISETCRGKRKTCQGYKWRYADL